VRQSQIDAARLEQSMVQEDSALTAGYRSDLKQYAGQLRDAMAEQREEMAALRSEWIRKTRLDAVGRTFDTLAGTDGRTFQHAVITRVTDVGVEFRHSTGTARLAAHQLSAEQQDAFALDTAVAYEAIQEENALASDFASWVDQGVADAAYREEVRQQALQEEERENQRLLSASTPARSSALHSAPRSALREEARAFGNGGSIWYPYYRTYRTHYYYVPSRACYTVPSIYRASSVPSVRSSPPNWSYSPR
jgi:hypothetical protein